MIGLLGIIHPAAQPGPEVGDSTEVENPDAIYGMTPRYRLEYKTLRNYDLKGCRVNDAKKANHGAYYGKRVLVK